MSSSRSLRARLGAVVAGFALAAVAVLGTAVPASAHDELVGSAPAAGEVVTAAPTVVELSFSGAIMSDGAEVVLTGVDGENWVGGALEIVDTTVTVPVREGIPSGAYELTWRVVSQDGHPISGVVPFTVEVPNLPVATPTPDVDDAVAPATATPEVTAISAPVAQNDESAVLLWVAVAVGALMASGLVVLFAVRARRH